MINYITVPFKWFFKLEAASGLLLLIGATIALILSNSDLSGYYFGVLKTQILIGTPNFGLDLSVLHWINDVLMCIFFFVVTLEIKREFINGELSRPKQASLPIIGAVGGMAIPAIIYIVINLESNNTLRGWAIPSATDIAFSIGVLSLLGKRVPISLKVFLLALAIIDDLGAILIIAFFYSSELQHMYLFLMIGSFLALLIINKFGVKKFAPFLLIGIFLWIFTHGSGIHSTISGVILALTIPHRIHEKDFSLLLKLEHVLTPYVAFGIMPLFALANAGVSLEGASTNTLMTPVPLGILCGLFFGKQIGVFLFSYISIKLKFAEMPSNSNWIKLYGVGILTGIGFTMSLFVGNLAFIENTQHMDGVKIGVLSGSLLSALVGYFILFLATNKKTTLSKNS
jgi:NhaA family Na+:H+ antiporter